MSVACQTGKIHPSIHVVWHEGFLGAVTVRGEGGAHPLRVTSSCRFTVLTHTSQTSTLTPAGSLESYFRHAAKFILTAIKRGKKKQKTLMFNQPNWQRLAWQHPRLRLFF